MEKEEWRAIPNYEGLYEISSLGRVKSLKFGKERILKTPINKDGYLNCNLCCIGKVKNFQVHQLVAMAFLNHIPCGLKLVVDHVNDNPQDNRLENLRVVTNRFNVYKTQGNYSSKYKGVCWDKRINKWVSHIYINGKLKCIGRFNCELSASIAYQNKLKEIL
jgi:hypothetical protein